MAQRHRTFARQEIFPSYIPNTLFAALSTFAQNFKIERVNSTTIQVAASADDGLAAIAVDGNLRWRESAVQAAHPGGAAGTYDIYVTASANDIDSTPAPNTDNTDYNFGLVIVTSGGTPTIVPGTVDHHRKVGELVWDGAAIVDIRSLVAQPPMLRGTAANRPAAATAGAGAVYWAYDTGQLSRSTGAAWEEVVPTISAFGKTLIDDADASAALSTLGFSAFGKTVVDDADAAAARSTLGLVIGTNVQAWSTALDEWAAKARPAGAVVGTSDTQTLSGKTMSDALLNGRRIAVTSKTGNYTVTSADEVVLCSASGGAFTITIPAAASHTGRSIRVKKTDSSTNQVTIARSGSDTLEGATSFGLRSQYATVMLASDGTNWHVIEFHPGLPATVLPSVAFDGQPHPYLADSSNAVVWDFIYRSAEATYKWVCVGGSPLVSTADPSTDPTMRATPGTFDALTGDVSLSCPFTGDYMVSYDQSVGPNASATTAIVAIECLTYLYWNGVQDSGVGHDIYTKFQYDTVDADYIGISLRAGGRWRRNAAPVGTVTPRHQAVRTNSIGNVTIDESTLELMPVRVV